MAKCWYNHIMQKINYQLPEVLLCDYSQWLLDSGCFLSPLDEMMSRFLFTKSLHPGRSEEQTKREEQSLLIESRKPQLQEERQQLLSRRHLWMIEEC